MTVVSVSVGVRTHVLRLRAFEGSLRGGGVVTSRGGIQYELTLLPASITSHSNDGVINGRFTTGSRQEPNRH
jgi:hypothetical protein